MTPQEEARQLASADVERDQLTLHTDIDDEGQDDAGDVVVDEGVEPSPLLAAAAQLPERPGTVAAEMEADRPADIGAAWDAWHRRKSSETTRKYKAAVVEFGRYLFAEAVDTYGNRIPVTARTLAPRPAPAEREPWAAETLVRLCSASMRAARVTVAEWVDHQLDAGTAPNTIRQRASALISFVDTAAGIGLVEWQLVITNLPPAVVVDRNANAGPAWDTVTRLRATARQRPDSPKARRDLVIVELLTTTGLRPFQLEGRTLAHLDLDAATLTVARKRSIDAEDAPLTSRVIDALGRWLDEYQPTTASSPLFPSITKGGRIKPTPMKAPAISNVVRGLNPAVTPKGIRHSVATRTRDRAGLDATADVLGHTDTRTTINYLDDERRRRTQTARTAAEHLGDD